LLDVIAAELDCDVQDIHDFELWVFFFRFFHLLCAVYGEVLVG
jgi:hypothetical protein